MHLQPGKLRYAICLKIIDFLYRTCNILDFVFVKRWSIFCNYCTVFDPQQYPWVLTTAVPHRHLGNDWCFYLGYTEVEEIRANSHLFGENSLDIKF